MPETRHSPPLVVLALAAALAAAVAACGDDPVGPTATELGLIGDYALVRFAGIDLPAVVADPDDDCVRLTMVSGSLTLEEPDGFSLAQRYHFASACDQPADTVDRVFGGTFALDSTGAEITLRPDEGARWWTMTGPVDSPQITLEPEIRPGDRDTALIGAYLFEKQDAAASGT